MALGRRLFEDLVSGAPHYDRRVIAVTSHHRAKVAFVPIGKERRVIVCALALYPRVERLIDDQYSSPVGKIEQLRCRRVMARSDRVYAHLLQDVELPLKCPLVKAGADRSKVMMLANAFQINAFTVEYEAPFIKRDGAYPKRGLITVNDRAFFLDTGNGYVEMRRPDRPQFGIRDRDIGPDGLRRARRNY